MDVYSVGSTVRVSVNNLPKFKRLLDQAKKEAEQLNKTISQLAEVEDAAPRYHDIKLGRIKPTRCECCDYCKATKRLSSILHYQLIKEASEW